MDHHNTQNNVLLTKLVEYRGYFIALLGLLMLVASLYFSNSMLADTTSGSVKKSLCETGLLVLQDLGAVLICFGLFNLISDTFVWRAYFEDRLKEVLINNKYLEKLSLPTLDHLQRNVTQIMSGQTDILQEGSFYNYFKNALESYHTKPHRENLEVVIIIAYNKNNKTYTATETISYTCRAKTGGTIQPDVKVSPRDDEWSSPCDITAWECTLPHTTQASPHSDIANNRKPCGNICDQRQDFCEGTPPLVINLKPRMKKEKNTRIVSLGGFANCDRLKINIKSTYSFCSNQFQTFGMAYPTHIINIKIIFPNDHEISRELFLAESKFTDSLEAHDDKQQKLEIDTNTWVLHRCGVAFSLRPKVKSKKLHQEAKKEVERVSARNR